MDNW